MDNDGGNQTRLTNNIAKDNEPVFTADGSKIVFVSNREGTGHEQIYIMNLDGSGQTRLTNNSASDTNPAVALPGFPIICGGGLIGL